MQDPKTVLLFGNVNGKNLVEKYVVDGTNVNNLTSKISKANTSGIKGVSWNKSREKWEVQITFKGKNYHLGRYDRIEDAAEIRAIAEKICLGIFQNGLPTSSRTDGRICKTENIITIRKKYAVGAPIAYFTSL